MIKLHIFILFVFLFGMTKADHENSFYGNAIDMMMKDGFSFYEASCIANLVRFTSNIEEIFNSTEQQFDQEKYRSKADTYKFICLPQLLNLVCVVVNMTFFIGIYLLCQKSKKKNKSKESRLQQRSRQVKNGAEYNTLQEIELKSLKM